ncbi:thioredoxin [Millisia brevis]|uniref:thioredoxin n=1 Tax=Millisia brevis TaxID=264148 RepID=UPI0008302C3F|nr:thioredoxin [Millisia brevis]
MSADANIVRCPSCGTRNRLPVSASGHPRCASCKAPLPWLVAAGDGDFSAAIDTSMPVLVDLWAPWCGPCRMIAPAVEKAATDYAGKLKAIKVNVDQAPQIASRYDAWSIPTLLMLRDGKVVSRQVGAVPQGQLLDWVGREIDA